jgi:predicted transcriptional regulator
MVDNCTIVELFLKNYLLINSLLFFVRNMKTAQQLLDLQIPSLNEDFDVSMALRWMDEFRVNELPVVVDGKYKGMLAETQLLDMEDQAHFIMPALKQESILPEDHFFGMVHHFAKTQSSLAAVVSKTDEYLGCVSREDLVDVLNDLTSAHIEGGVVILEMNPRDYTLQQIARIVEENDAKITTLFSYPNEKGMLEVMIKIDIKNINPILKSLERFDYRVRSSFQHPDANIDLLDRYDTLMRFLDED